MKTIRIMSLPHLYIYQFLVSKREKIRQILTKSGFKNIKHFKQKFLMFINFWKPKNNLTTSLSELMIFLLNSFEKHDLYRLR